MLPQIKKILYCTDLSENSAFACRYAMLLARRTGAQIHFLHVAEKLSPDALVTLESYLRNFEGREKFLSERVAHTKKILNERLEKFLGTLGEDEQGVREQIASINVCEAYPVDEILKQTEALGCDLIVMGTHQKGVKQAFLGSVSKRVLSQSPVPALVVPLPKT